MTAMAAHWQVEHTIEDAGYFLRTRKQSITPTAVSQHNHMQARKPTSQDRSLHRRRAQKHAAIQSETRVSQSKSKPKLRTSRHQTLHSDAAAVICESFPGARAHYCRSTVCLQNRRPQDLEAKPTRCTSP
jgi:hypothetical protein